MYSLKESKVTLPRVNCSLEDVDAVRVLQEQGAKFPKRWESHGKIGTKERHGRHLLYFILFYLFYFLVLGIELRGILTLSYTPSPILFFISKQGLTRLLRVSLSR